MNNTVTAQAGKYVLGADPVSVVRNINYALFDGHIDNQFGIEINIGRVNPGPIPLTDLVFGLQIQLVSMLHLLGMSNINKDTASGAVIEQICGHDHCLGRIFLSP